MKFQTLTNVRPTREKGTSLIVNTTRGSLKMTPKAAEAVGVADGEYIGLVKAGDTVFLFRGSDELGAKLASSKKGGAGDLNFSTSFGWELLKGNSEEKQHYNVAEEGIQFPTEGTPEAYVGKDMFALTFEKSEPKIARKASADKEEKGTSTDSEKGNDTKVQEPVTSDISNDDFADL